MLGDLWLGPNMTRWVETIGGDIVPLHHHHADRRDRRSDGRGRAQPAPLEVREPASLEASTAGGSEELAAPLVDDPHYGDRNEKGEVWMPGEGWVDA